MFNPKTTNQLLDWGVCEQSLIYLKKHLTKFLQQSKVDYIFDSNQVIDFPGKVIRVNIYVQGQASARFNLSSKWEDFLYETKTENLIKHIQIVFIENMF